jgi:phosphatidylinositol glycan class T
VLWRQDEGVEVRLTFQSVSDPLRISSSRKQSKLADLLACVIVLTLDVDWSFQSLFGRTIERSCPVAESSRVFVTLPTDGLYSILPEPPSVAAGLANYDVNNGTPRHDI